MIYFKNMDRFYRILLLGLSTVQKNILCIGFLVLFLGLQCSLYGQFKSIGVPEIRNIDRSEYGGGTQSWDIVDDSQGNIYIGNNNGILRFDGEDWNTISVTNNSMVRSLANGSDDKIYVGAYNEIGYLEQSAKEGIKYHTLNHLIPEDAKDFDDVWGVFQTRFGLIFQSFEYVFIYNDDKIQVLRPNKRFGASFHVDNNFYIVEKGIGLRILRDGTLHTYSDDPIFSKDEIRFLEGINGDDLLIGTQNLGLYTLSDGILQPWEMEISEELQNSKLYCGSFHNNRYLFGTVKSGLYVVNEEGTIQQHVSRLNGLQNNTILSLYIDGKNNIWLGLDIGITFLKSSLPISYINDNFNIAATYATAICDERLYVGTNQGLYSKELSKLRNHTDIKYDFVEGTEGQVWDLSVIDGQLLCGHHNGAYLIEGNKSKRLTDSRGVWNFRKIPGHDELLLSGTYDGLITFSKGNKGAWRFRGKIKGIDISSKELIVKEENNIWMNHGYLGLFHIYLNENIDSVIQIKEYKGTNNLPDELPYLLHETGDDFFLSTNQGIYQFDDNQEVFTKSEELNQLFGDLKLIYLLKEDTAGNIWYSAEQGMGVFRLLEDGTRTNIVTPFQDLNKARVSPFDNIYIQDAENVFIGTQFGLVHYDPTFNKNYFEATKVFINRVSISSRKKDSLWYASGNFQLADKVIEDDFSLPHSFNNIAFKYNSPDTENSGHIEYSHRLNNFDEDWSDWSADNMKEYTNLRGGNYYFEIRARNAYNNISSIDQFHFYVEPPFYRSNTALILYLVFSVVLIFLVVYFYLRRIDKVRAQEKNRQLSVFNKKEKALELEKQAAEQEVVHLKNEKLEDEMKHKNKELVTSTIHIGQKNNFLNSLKNELANLSQSAKSEIIDKELKRICRKIDRDIQQEKNWEVFDRYFDEVHQEFLVRLKEYHPELSPSEIRLSAYLRMNISTKEIAPLMNISIRGVEVSRYRLRKKLNLDRDTNLTKYIMQV